VPRREAYAGSCYPCFSLNQPTLAGEVIGALDPWKREAPKSVGGSRGAMGTCQKEKKDDTLSSYSTFHMQDMVAAADAFKCRGRLPEQSTVFTDPQQSAQEEHKMSA